MSQEKSPAFQMYPADYLSDIKVQAMTLEEEGAYNRLMQYCWREVVLPDDHVVLASLCKGVSPSDLVLSCFVRTADGLRHKRLDEERVKQEEWRNKSALGGQRSAHKRKHLHEKSHEQGGTTTVPPARLKGGGTLLSSSSVFSLQSSSSKSIEAQQASPLDENLQTPAESTPEKALRPKDEAYETWSSEFIERRQCPYRHTKGDFVQLSTLRKALNLEARGVPDRWVDAVRNYLMTPQGKYTLADLCTRYDVFLRGALDRFSKPIGEDNGQRKSGSASPGMAHGQPAYVPRQRNMPQV